eukprot:1482662-Prorocentrum_lima.AAC.1
MDISAAFLKGMTIKEIAKETGDTLRSVQSTFHLLMSGSCESCQAWKTTTAPWKFGPSEGHMGIQGCSTSI